MSPYLIAFLGKVWDWLIAPPANWTLSLSTEWKIELAAVALILSFRRTVIELGVIGRELMAEAWAEHQRAREWNHYGSMEEADFDNVLARLNDQADREEELSDRLMARARSSGFQQTLRAAAERRRGKASHCRSEVRRLRELWAAVETARQEEERRRERENIIDLMRQLTWIDERAGHAALNELRRFSNSFDWESLLPEKMLRFEKERIVRCLRIMAGTSLLGEARNAYETAERLLREAGWERWSGAV